MLKMNNDDDDGDDGNDSLRQSVFFVVVLVLLCVGGILGQMITAEMRYTTVYKLSLLDCYHSAIHDL